MNKLVLSAFIAFFGAHLEVNAENSTVWSEASLARVSGVFGAPTEGPSSLGELPESLLFPLDNSLFTEAIGQAEVRLYKSQCTEGRREKSVEGYEKIELRKFCYLRIFKTEAGLTVDFLVRALVDPSSVGGGYTVFAAGTFSKPHGGDWYASETENLSSPDIIRVKDLFVAGIGTQSGDIAWREVAEFFNLSSHADLVAFFSSYIGGYMAEMVESDAWPSILERSLVHTTNQWYLQQK